MRHLITAPYMKVKTMIKYRVAESFISINGEASRAGELALFIRFAGCNLNCNYCDTEWANKPDVEVTERTASQMIDMIREAGVSNVTITGGEPLIQPGIVDLLSELRKLADETGIRFEIETNGAVDIKPAIEAFPDCSITLDYKCLGSGMEKFNYLDNYRLVRPIDSVKFVVSDEADMDKMREIVEEYDLTKKCKVYVSAVFNRIDPEEIARYMIDNRLNDYKLQLQIHKYIWDPEERGV